MLPDADDGPPEVISILMVPAGDARVGHADIDERVESDFGNEVEAEGVADFANDLVVQSRRGAEFLRAIVSSKNTHHRLLGLAVGEIVASFGIDLVVGSQVGRVNQRRRSRQRRVSAGGIG